MSIFFESKKSVLFCRRRFVVDIRRRNQRWITDQGAYRKAKLVFKASTENGAAGNRTHEGKMAGGSQATVHTVRQKCRFPELSFGSKIDLKMNQKWTQKGT